jgi:hypothetical protein
VEDGSGVERDQMHWQNITKENDEIDIGKRHE